MHMCTGDCTPSEYADAIWECRVVVTILWPCSMLVTRLLREESRGLFNCESGFFAPSSSCSDVINGDDDAGAKGLTLAKSFMRVRAKEIEYRSECNVSN